MTEAPATSAQTTTDYFAASPGWWRPCLTPARASWLDQAELLNHAFDLRYLKRGSWTSREAYIAHVMSSWPEYNRRYAHPFEWTWTNQKMRQWFAEHAQVNFLQFLCPTTLGRFTRDPSGYKLRAPIRRHRPACAEPNGVRGVNRSQERGAVFDLRGPLIKPAFCVATAGGTRSPPVPSSAACRPGRSPCSETSPGRPSS